MDEENNNIQAEVETHEEQDDCGEVESEDEGMMKLNHRF